MFKRIRGDQTFPRSIYKFYTQAFNITVRTDLSKFLNLDETILQNPFVYIQILISKAYYDAQSITTCLKIFKLIDDQPVWES